MSLLVLALGLVLIVEGLALALAPSRMEEVLRLIAGLSRDQRRAIGLAAIAIGLALAALGRNLLGG